MYNTMLGVDVPVELMTRLDEMAHVQNVTRSVLVRRALAKFAGMKIVEQKRSDRDGQESKALAMLRECPKLSIREIEKRLHAAGIQRGRDWVNRKRQELPMK